MLVEDYKAKKNDILSYTPCRVSECYGDIGYAVEIPSVSARLQLKGAGRFVWLCCDGKTTIAEISEKIADNMGIQVNTELQQHVIKLVSSLADRYVLVANWDPIFKAELPQNMSWED